MRQERRELGGGGLDEKSVRLGEDGGIALDAALRVEEEAVVAFVGLQLLDGVGDHAVEPPDAVFAGYAEPAGLIERGDAGCFE